MSASTKRLTKIVINQIYSKLKEELNAFSLTKLIGDASLTNRTIEDIKKNHKLLAARFEQTIKTI